MHLAGVELPQKVKDIEVRKQSNSTRKVALPFYAIMSYNLANFSQVRTHREFYKKTAYIFFKR